MPIIICWLRFLKLLVKSKKETQADFSFPTVVIIFSVVLLKIIIYYVKPKQYLHHNLKLNAQIY